MISSEQCSDTSGERTRPRVPFPAPPPEAKVQLNTPFICSSQALLMIKIICGD